VNKNIASFGVFAIIKLNISSEVSCNHEKERMIERCLLEHSTLLCLAQETLVERLDGNGAAMDATITKYASQLDGRTIIDTANRMGGGPMNSFATLQQHTPRAHIFRAFNTLGWENFAYPEFEGGTADLFYCGPDGEARGAVEQLITNIGLRPMYLGGVEQVGLVDAVVGLWFALAVGQGKGRHLAFKVLTQ
jgi:hypothetical protein